MYDYLLMAPGPVPLSPEVKHILAEDMIHHRSPLFQAALDSVMAKLPNVFACDGKVLFFTSTGTGAMEACMLNFVGPGDKVAVVNSGKFGERWLQMAYRIGCEVIEIPVKWGESLKLEQVTHVLEQHPDLDAFFTQYCETSTGALHPVKQIASYIKERQASCLVAVDAITAVLTTELNMREWGIDLCVAGSQKAFMLPTGLGFLAISEHAEERIKKDRPFLYFDITQELKARKSGQTAYSSNVPLIRALDMVLEKIEQDGLQNFISNVQARAELCRRALAVMNLEIYPQNPAPALTAFRSPEGMDGAKLRNHLEERYNLTLMGGQEHLKGKILRIGHMGHLSHANISDAMIRLAHGLADFSYEVDMQKLEKALS